MVFEMNRLIPDGPCSMSVTMGSKFIVIMMRESMTTQHKTVCHKYTLVHTGTPASFFLRANLRESISPRLFSPSPSGGLGTGLGFSKKPNASRVVGSLRGPRRRGGGGGSLLSASWLPGKNIVYFCIALISWVASGNMSFQTQMERPALYLKLF